MFAGLGAHVRRLHALEKPSAGDIAAAADALGIPDIIVLPNHENVVLAAQQAATLTRCTLRLVPATSMPQGVAACIAFDGGQTALTNIEEMTAALEHIHTIEVTAAAADRVVDGIAVTEGQPMALLDGRLVAVAASHHEALLAAAIKAAAGATLVTVYGGADCAPGELESARLALADGLPGIEIVEISGGQALYKFIASVRPASVAHRRGWDDRAARIRQPGTREPALMRTRKLLAVTLIVCLAGVSLLLAGCGRRLRALHRATSSSSRFRITSSRRRR